MQTGYTRHAPTQNVHTNTQECMTLQRDESENEHNHDNKCCLARVTQQTVQKGHTHLEVHVVMALDSSMQVLVTTRARVGANADATLKNWQQRSMHLHNTALDGRVFKASFWPSTERNQYFGDLNNTFSKKPSTDFCTYTEQLPSMQRSQHFSC